MRVSSDEIREYYPSLLSIGDKLTYGEFKNGELKLFSNDGFLTYNHSYTCILENNKVSVFVEGEKGRKYIDIPKDSSSLVQMKNLLRSLKIKELILYPIYP